MFAGGDWNLFRYAASSPVNYIDPTGLLTCCQISCIIEGRNDCRCTGRIFGWGCGNNPTEAIQDAENGRDNEFSANSRMRIWNRIHDLHCQKRHCHPVRCQDERFRKARLPRAQPVVAPIAAFGQCSDGTLILLCVVSATVIVCACYALPLAGGVAEVAIGGYEVEKGLKGRQRIRR